MSSSFVVVAPKSKPHYALYGTQNMFLCQAQWCIEDRHYLEFYTTLSRAGSHIILDNMHPLSGQTQQGAMAHLDFKAYVDVVNYLRPTEVIIPDVFQDRIATLDMLEQFFAVSGPHGEFNEAPQYMFVPQGNNIDEWCDCLRIAIGSRKLDARFKTVGIPMWLSSIGARRTALNMAEKICQDQFTGSVWKDFHMLGLWTGPDEMFADNRIRSWDSSWPVSAAQHSHKFVWVGTNPKWHMEDKPCDVDLLVANAAACQFLLHSPRPVEHDTQEPL